MDWDVVVIGAGAAGLLAAAQAAARGRRTLLLEKNNKAGVKILMSGGTRCNVTHDTDRQGIVKAYGPPGRFLHSALAALGPAEVRELFHAEGVPTKVEETGKVFPASDRALDVRDALVRRLHRCGAQLALGEPALELKPRDQGFEVVTPKRTLIAESAILCAGGMSYSGCGTTGDGYGWARALGHAIVTPRPALTPLTHDAGWARELSGITVPDAALQVVDPAGARPRALDQRRGGFLFTHVGASGPAPMNISRAVTSHPQPKTLLLECDFLPSVAAAILDERFRAAAAAAGKRTLVGLLPELPHRLVEALLIQAGLPPDRRAAELPRAARAAAVDAVKRQRLPLAGTLGFPKAEVTAGGVALDEVDSRTFRSKKHPNLFLAGEVLDLDGPIGGFNFQAAFSGGWLAGQHA